MHEFVTVAEFLKSDEAHLLQGLLEEHGISATVEDELLATTAWLYQTAIRGVRLTVPIEDAETAMPIIAEGRQRWAARASAANGDTSRSSRECSRGHLVEPAAAACLVCGEELLPVEVSAAIEVNDHRIERAFRAAVMGLVFLPVLMHILSIGLLVKIALSDADSSPRLQTKWWAAFLISGAVLFLAFWFAAQLLAELSPQGSIWYWWQSFVRP